MGDLVGRLSQPQNLTGMLSPPSTLTGSMSLGGGTYYPVYDGATEVTPSAATQVLQTERKVLRQDIVVNPIPSNYGLITWNGSVLMVS